MTVFIKASFIGRYPVYLMANKNCVPTFHSPHRDMVLASLILSIIHEVLAFLREIQASVLAYVVGCALDVPNDLTFSIMYRSEN